MLRATLCVVLLTAGSLVGCGGEDSATPEPQAAGRFSVVITDAGDMKIQAIKMVREITGLGLKEAKDLVDGVSSVIKDDLPAGEARSLAEKLRGAGMTVDVRPR